MQDQYFPADLIAPDENEVIIDCGAYTGDTIDSFFKIYNNNFKKIVCFEADEDNFTHLKANHGNDNRITLISSGVYGGTKTLYFFQKRNLRFFWQ